MSETSCEQVVPSIVVHNGSSSAPSSPTHENPARQLTLSKQASTLDDSCDEGVDEGSDQMILDPCNASVALSQGPSTASPSPPASISPSLQQQSPSPQGPGPGGGPSSLGGSPRGHSPHQMSSPHSRSLDFPPQRSTDSEKEGPPPASSLRRQHHGAKLKLLQRSHAMREDTSPPPDLQESPHGHILTVGGSAYNSRRKLRHQSSSQGSFDGSSPCLSRDSSTEYTDSSGVDLLQFIIQTLHKNQKDRMLLLKIERELVNLVKDAKRTHHKFPQMSSYQRMLVHRCAAYFGLEHNVDQVGTAVIVNKTRATRIPEIRFREHCRDELLPPDEPKRSILRREFSSFEDCPSFKSFSSTEGMLDSPSRSYDDHESRRGSHEEIRWHEHRSWAFMESESHHRKHHYDNHRLRPGRLPKVESFESPDSRHLRSLRPPVFKSHSFGGYSAGVTVLSRGDSVTSNVSSHLSKQDSTNSRYSEQSSSSGYKTMRQDTSSTNVSNTLSTTPSPTACPLVQIPFGQSPASWNTDPDGQPVMWAVTDLEAVPSGAILINPQTGQPFMNADGTLYRFDPNNPPMSGASKEPSAGAESLDLEKSKDEEEIESLSPGVAYQVPGSPALSHELTSTAGSSPGKSTCSSKVEASEMLPSRKSSSHLEPKNRDMPKGQKSEKELDSLDSEEAVGADSELSHPPPPPPPPCSQFYTPGQDTSLSEISQHFQGMSISSSADQSASGTREEKSPPLVSASPVQPSYSVARQQYSQPPLYYIPTANISNPGSTNIKYIYPQYQMAPPGAGLHSASSLQSAVGAGPVVPPTPSSLLPGVQGMSVVSPLGSVSTPVTPHGASGTGSIEQPAMMPAGGYMPGGYAVVAYPQGGLVGTGGTTAQEAGGGTTYYCALPGAASAVGHVPPTPSGSLGQFALTPPSTSTSFAPLGSSVGYYSASGMNSMNSSAVYQGTNVIPAAAVLSSNLYGPSQQPPSVGPAVGVAYRANSPPTPSAQGLSMPLGFVGGAGPPGSSSVGSTPGVTAGQYVAVLPPSQQQSTPPSHAHPQIYPNFFRQLLSSSSAASASPPAPPQPLVQLGGSSSIMLPSAGAITQHPPVFAKPFAGSCKDPQDEAPLKQCFWVSPGAPPNAQSSPHIVASASTQPSYSIIQNGLQVNAPSLNFSSNYSNLNAPGMPVLIATSRNRPGMFSSPAPATLPLGFPRPAKMRRQKSRISYLHNSYES